MRSNILFEIKRKLFHVLSVIYIIIFVLVAKYYGKQWGILALIGILILFLLLEFLRIKFNFKVPIFHKLWRQTEKKQIGGEVYFIIGAIIAFSVFDFNCF